MSESDEVQYETDDELETELAMLIEEQRALERIRTEAQWSNQKLYEIADEEAAIRDRLLRVLSELHRRRQTPH